MSVVGVVVLPDRRHPQAPSGMHLRHREDVLMFRYPQLLHRDTTSGSILHPHCHLTNPPHVTAASSPVNHCIPAAYSAHADSPDDRCDGTPVGSVNFPVRTSYRLHHLVNRPPTDLALPRATMDLIIPCSAQ